MPTYLYRCPSCAHPFERVQKITAPAGARCPRCGKAAERQLSAGVGFVFKGSGFYATDYKRAGATEQSAEGGAAPASKRKSGKKPETSKPQSSDSSD